MDKERHYLAYFKCISANPSLLNNGIQKSNVWSHHHAKPSDMLDPRTITKIIKNAEAYTIKQRKDAVITPNNCLCKLKWLHESFPEK